jgi:hypothetical protein|tara:strand:- start:401 stop:979 length:579 start_codon:yes stop_codon:yes gene_type:complete
MIVNILKTLPWYFIGIAVLGVPAILLMGSLFAPLDVESFISPDWVSNAFMDSVTILEDGQDITMATTDFYFMFAWLNVNLLIVTIIFSLSWSIGSHFLNINEPGKAKFFGISWVIVSAIFVGLLIIVNFTILSWGDTFPAAQDITTESQTTMIILTVIYYSLMYWISVILGTARQARSAVLFANKLPARNFL